MHIEAGRQVGTWTICRGTARPGWGVCRAAAAAAVVLLLLLLLSL